MQASFRKAPLALALSLSLSTLPALAAGKLEEVTVTARKVEESLQDAPLAVSAATRNEIEMAAMGDAMAIVQFAPNIVFDEIPTGTVGGGGLSIRGISYQDVEKSFDPTVIIYLDGVPHGTGTNNVTSLLDIERIEVLRGPQGTLFGKNAVGGVINVFRIKPRTGEWAGKVRAQLEDGDTPTYEGVLNIPLGDTLAVKLSAARVETPAYFENITPGGEDGGDSQEDRYGIHLLWEPNDDLTAEFQYNKTQKDGIQTPTLNTSDESKFFCFGLNACGSSKTPYSGDRTKTAGDVPNVFSYDSESYQVNLNYTINSDLDMVLIAAHGEDEEFAILDTDDNPGSIFTGFYESGYEQDSVELRFDYTRDRLSFSGGYFYWKSKMPFWRRGNVSNGFFGFGTGITVDQLYGPQPADNSYCTFALPCNEEFATYGSESDSYFFEANYALTDQLSLIAGARYIDEEKKISKISGNPIFGVTTLPLTRSDRTDSDTIYRLGLRYEFNIDTMMYATYSTGFRSGGFSIRSQSPEVLGAGYDPETLTNYEIGLKTTLFDQRLQLNLAGFYMTYEDIQVELQIAGPGGVGTQSAVINAAEATLYGAEVEVNALLTDNLILNFNMGLLDASYDKFNGKVFEDDTFESDNSDLDLRRAPELNYTVALNYNREVGPGELFGRVSYFWTDEYEGAVTNFPGGQIESYGILDASVNYRFGNWLLGVFGRNLTDEDAWSHNFGVAINRDGSGAWTFVSPRKPRTFGVQLTYTFGDY
ncbi:MAG: TonB-dependent receptor [Parahaliea sp.]